MTIRERIKNWLYAQGMFEHQAVAVIEMVEADDASTNKVMVGRWDEEYPDAMFNVLLPTVKETALKYIDANCPKAWFRPMFV